VIFREKIKLASLVHASGVVFFSAFRNLREGFVSGNHPQNLVNPASLRQDYFKQDCPPDLRAPVNILKAIRRRLLANTLLSGWMAWAGWILTGLIVAGALSAKLAVWMVLAVFLAVIGAIAIFAWVWRTRLSIYETARRLDEVAGLQDRISTAIYLGEARNPEGVIQRQRRDAVSRLRKVEPRGLFPVRMPAAAPRALLLVLAVAGLFTYRIDHKAPLVALVQTTARSPLVQSMRSPLAHGIQKDLQRSISQVTLESKGSAGQDSGSDARSSSEDLWSSGDKAGGDPQADQQNSLEVGGMPQDQMQGPSDQTGASSAAFKQDRNSGAPWQDATNENTGRAETSAQPPDAQRAGNTKQSLGQSLMQALKNMFSKSSTRQSDLRNSQLPQPPMQDAPQSGDFQQPGTTENDRKSESRGISDAKDQSSQNAGSGAGSQQGTKMMRRNLETHPVNAVPDRVALQASGYRDQTRVRVDPETGTARLGVQNVPLQGETVVNGAEQENIPARYRLYVQRYFTRVDNRKQ